MQVPLVAGRNFTAVDRANPYVALISEQTARKAFPAKIPLAEKSPTLFPTTGKITIIGVVADTRINGLRDTAAMVYIPYWEFTPWTLRFWSAARNPATR